MKYFSYMAAAILFEQPAFWLAKIMSTNHSAADKRSPEVRMNHAQNFVWL